MKIAAKSLNYHGTSSKNIRTILKEGLIPFPKETVYDKEEREGGFSTTKTFGGAYFIRDWMYAYSAAGKAVEKFGGNRLIIEAIIEDQNQDVLPDEDDVVSLLRRALGSHAEEMPRRLFNRTEFSSLRESLDGYSIARAIDACNTDPNIEKRIKKGLDASDFSILAEQVLNTGHSRLLTVLSKADSGFKRDLIKSTAEALKAYVYHLFHQHSGLKCFKEGSWENFSAALNDLSRRIKGPWGEKDETYISIRSMKPVGFSGASRIKSILEIIENTDRELIPTLRSIYGNTNNQERLYAQKINPDYTLKEASFSREQKLMGKVDDAFHNLIMEMRKEDENDPESKVVEYLQGRIHRILKKHFGKSPNDKYYKEKKDG